MTLESGCSACAVPLTPLRPLEATVGPHRAAMIRSLEKQWINGTTLRYCFLEKPALYRGEEAQKNATRAAFRTWKALGIWVSFQEVAVPQEAEIRISFQLGQSWSHIGRDCIDLKTPPSRPTMNLVGDLSDAVGRDIALHEVGHVLGFYHEHQKVRAQILTKVASAALEGSAWDPDSIMQYPFPAGLILQPERYRTQPLIPKPGLSPTDVARTQALYPPIRDQDLPLLQPYQSRSIDVVPGSQVDFAVSPPESRVWTMQTFGAMDTVLALFEDWPDGQAYLPAADDSGSEKNARLAFRLERGRRYLLRLRLHYIRVAGEGALMLW